MNGFKLTIMCVVTALATTSVSAQGLFGPVETVDVVEKSNNPNYAKVLLWGAADYYLAGGRSDFEMGVDANLKASLYFGSIGGEARFSYGFFDLNSLDGGDPNDSIPDGKPSAGLNPIQFSIGGTYYYSRKTVLDEVPWAYKSRQLATNLILVNTVKHPTKVTTMKGVRGGLYYLSTGVPAEEANGGVLATTNANGELFYFDDGYSGADNGAVGDTAKGYTRLDNTGIYIGYESTTRMGGKLLIKTVGTNDVFPTEAYSTSSVYVDLLLTPIQYQHNIVHNNRTWTLPEGSGAGFIEPRMWGARLGYWAQGSRGLGVNWGLELYAQPGVASYGFNMSFGLGWSTMPGKSPKVNDFSDEMKKMENLDEFKKNDSTDGSESGEPSESEDEKNPQKDI